MHISQQRTWVHHFVEHLSSSNHGEFKEAGKRAGGSDCFQGLEEVSIESGGRVDV